MNSKPKANFILKLYREAVVNVPLLKYSWILIATICILALSGYFRLENKAVFLYAIGVILISVTGFIFSLLLNTKDRVIRYLSYALLSCMIAVMCLAVLGFGLFILTGDTPRFYVNIFINYSKLPLSGPGKIEGYTSKILVPKPNGTIVSDGFDTIDVGKQFYSLYNIPQDVTIDTLSFNYRVDRTWGSNRQIVFNIAFYDSRGTRLSHFEKLALSESGDGTARGYQASVHLPELVSLKSGACYLGYSITNLNPKWEAILEAGVYNCTVPPPGEDPDRPLYFYRTVFDNEIPLLKNLPIGNFVDFNKTQPILKAANSYKSFYFILK